MVRSLITGIGLVAMLAALVIGGYQMVKSFDTDLTGGSPGGAEGPLVVRVSGDPGVAFDGNYTTTSGSESFNGTLQTAPVQIELPDESVAGVAVVTVNIRRRGVTGYLKAELVQNGRVVQMQETNAATGTLNLTYSP